jgi:two-component system, cell cycle sensor histidine kinase and response regulator CckA
VSSIPQIVAVRGTILLVDDEPDVLDYLAQQLRSAGYDVTPVLSGEEALQIYDKSTVSFDVLVADLVLPGMSGFTLSDLLIAKDKRLKRIFISGHTGAEYFRQAGVSSTKIPFLQKPFAPEELLESIGELMAGRAPGAGKT